VETEARAAATPVVAASEAGEEMRTHFFGDAEAVVRDAEDRLEAAPLYRYCHVAVSGGVLEGVRDEVGDRAPHVTAVTDRARRAAFTLHDRQLDMAGCSERLQLGGDLTCDLVEIDDVAIGPAIAALEACYEEQRFREALHVVGRDDAVLDGFEIPLRELAVRAGLSLAQCHA